MNLPEMGRIPINDFERVKNMAHIRTESGTPITSNFIGPNHKRLSDKRVRQAIMYAINREIGQGDDSLSFPSGSDTLQQATPWEA